MTAPAHPNCTDLMLSGRKSSVHATLVDSGWLADPGKLRAPPACCRPMPTSSPLWRLTCRRDLCFASRKYDPLPTMALVGRVGGLFRHVQSLCGVPCIVYSEQASNRWAQTCTCRTKNAEPQELECRGSRSGSELSCRSKFFRYATGGVGRVCPNPRNNTNRQKGGAGTGVISCSELRFSSNYVGSVTLEVRKV